MLKKHKKCCISMSKFWLWFTVELTLKNWLCLLEMHTFAAVQCFHKWWFELDFVFLPKRKFLASRFPSLLSDFDIFHIKLDGEIHLFPIINISLGLGLLTITFDLEFFTGLIDFDFSTAWWTQINALTYLHSVGKQV